MNPDKVSVLIIGAGAVGSYFGGSLLAQGHSVSFYDRPETAKRFLEHGLLLTRPGMEPYRIESPDISADMAEILRNKRFDFALFSVKSYDTEDIARHLGMYQPDLPPILCLQNGVENEDRLKGILSRTAIYAGSVTTAIGRRGANEIVVEKLRGVGLAPEGEVTRKMAAAMNASGLNARLYKKINEMKWSKMITNLPSNALSAILGMPPGQVLSHKALFRLEILQLREALQVMKAYGIKVVDLPATPVRALTWIVENLPPFISQPILLQALAKGRGDKMPSFFLDLESGRRKSEVDYLNGAVVRFGNRVGLTATVNQMYSEILLGLTEGRIDRSLYLNQPEKILNDLTLRGGKQR